MKLQVVPASRGIQWVRLGLLTFFRQPLALSGLFLLFSAAMLVIKALPLLGPVAAYLLMPGAILGLMAAAREASNGKFPMPWMLLSAFRAGSPQLRAMLLLGVGYAAGIISLLVTSMAIDGGTLANMALMGQPVTEDKLQEMPFLAAMMLVAAFDIPWILLFSHAAALVHWHQIPPGKALFFSAAAMFNNFKALLVYGLVWIGVFQVFGIMAKVLATLMGSDDGIPVIVLPMVMLLLASVFTSIYFTFLDSFAITPGADT